MAHIGAQDFRGGLRVWDVGSGTGAVLIPVAISSPTRMNDVPPTFLTGIYLGPRFSSVDGKT